MSDADTTDTTDTTREGHSQSFEWDVPLTLAELQLLISGVEHLMEQEEEYNTFEAGTLASVLHPHTSRAQLHVRKQQRLSTLIEKLTAKQYLAEEDVIKAWTEVCSSTEHLES